MATSKKDYVAIARMIELEMEIAADVQSDIEKRARQGMCRVIAGRMADYFGGDNRSFDRNRFLDACGVNKEGNR